MWMKSDIFCTFMKKKKKNHDVKDCMQIQCTLYNYTYWYIFFCMNNLVDLAQTPDSLGLEDLAKCYTKHRHHNVGTMQY